MLSLFSSVLILIAKFSHVTTLNTYIHNDTHWESLSDFIPSKNTSYGNITLHNAVEMEFDFIYYGRTTVNKWENIFRIGYGGDNNCPQAGTRYPAMWIHPNTGELQITISAGKTSNQCWDNNDKRKTIEKYQKYHVFIKFNLTWRYASVNTATETDVLINEPHSDPIYPNPLWHTVMNVWISTKHAAAANFTLSNITFKTWDPITLEPTNNPSRIPTTSPTNIPTIYTINPTQIPSVTPTINPTQIPSLIPTINPTQIPSLTPTYNPTESPSTLSPSITPSKSPSNKPTTDPTYRPTEDEINAREPTNNPTDEGHIFETTTYNMIKNTDNSLQEESDSWISYFNANSVALIIPIVIGFFVFIICCFMLLCCKRYNLQIHKSLSPSLKSANNNENENENDNEEDDIIFGKIYDKQIQLNMEKQKQKNNNSDNNNNNNNSDNIDILLPNEDSFESLSSGAAEEMYIQTHPSTITAPQQEQEQQEPIIMGKSDPFNISLQQYHKNSSKDTFDLDSIKQKKSYSFNSKIKQNRSYSHQVSESNSIYSHELELQHQVTLAISNRNNNIGEGVNNNNNNNNNMEYEHGSDSEEEDDDIDIYNGDVAPPSSGQQKYIYNKNKNKNNKNNNNNHQLVMSHSTTPEMDLYGRGKISNGVDFNIDSNNDDVKSNDSLYIKPNSKYLETPTKIRRDENIILELYDKPLYINNNNNENNENIEGCDDYEWIKQSLKICDPIDWKKYLNNFKKNKVSDFRLNQLTENDWIQLIPIIGPRNYFKQLWVQYEKHTAKSIHLNL